MSGAYSLDLRKKIIAVHKQEKISQNKLAKRFGVSASSVNRYIKLEEEGNLSPQVGEKGRPGKMDDKGYSLLKKSIEKNPTITLEELSQLFFKKKKLKVGRSILSRACQKLELRYKKLSRYAIEQDREEVKKNESTI